MEIPKYITMAEYAAMRRTDVKTLYSQYSQRKNPTLAERLPVGNRKFLIRLEDAIASIENGQIIS